MTSIANLYHRTMDYCDNFGLMFGSRRFNLSSLDASSDYDFYLKEEQYDILRNNLTQCIDHDKTELDMVCEVHTYIVIHEDVKYEYEESNIYRNRLNNSHALKLTLEGFAPINVLRVESLDPYKVVDERYECLTKSEDAQAWLGAEKSDRHRLYEFVIDSVFELPEFQCYVPGDVDEVIALDDSLLSDDDDIPF